MIRATLNYTGDSLRVASSEMIGMTLQSRKSAHGQGTKVDWTSRESTFSIPLKEDTIKAGMIRALRE